jgi:hypothetical protein
MSTVARTTTAGEFKTGVAGLKITAPGAGLCTAYTPAGTIEVAPGEHIVAQYTYRQDDGDAAGLLALFYDDDDLLVGMVTRGFSSVPNAVSTWQMCAGVFRVPDDATQVRFVVGWVADATSDILYIDDFFVRRTSLVTASTVRTSDGGPRIEMFGTPRGGIVEFFTSSRNEDNPAAIIADEEYLTIEAPTVFGVAGPAEKPPRLVLYTAPFDGGIGHFSGSLRAGWLSQAMGRTDSIDDGPTYGVPAGRVGKQVDTADVTGVAGTETDVVEIADCELFAYREYDVNFACDRVTGDGTSTFVLRLYVDGVEVFSKVLTSLLRQHVDFTWPYQHGATDDRAAVKVTLQRTGGATTADVKADIALTINDVGAGIPVLP